MRASRRVPKSAPAACKTFKVKSISVAILEIATF